MQSVSAWAQRSQPYGPLTQKTGFNEAKSLDELRGLAAGLAVAFNAPIAASCLS